jgi:hypothetical protein
MVTVTPFNIVGNVVTVRKAPWPEPNVAVPFR